MCTGKRELSPTCFDVSIFKAPIGDRGGFTTVINGGTGQLIVDENGIVIS